MNENVNQPEMDIPQEPPLQQTDFNAEITAKYNSMLRELRSWGFWSLGLGVVHIVSSGFLDAGWGILLIVVGLASFYFRTAPMFIVYTVTLLWAGLSNLISSTAGWMVFAVLQAYLAFRTFKDFQRFGKMESEFSQLSDVGMVFNQRAKNAFPWIGSIFGCSSIVGLVSLIGLTLFLAAAYGWESTTPFYYTLMQGVVETAGVLGFSVSLASLLSGHRPKSLPIIGLIGGGLFMIAWLALVIYAN